MTTEPDENGVIHVTMEVAEESIQKPVIRCDESLYYDMLSAFCKSLRGSDAERRHGVVRAAAVCGRRSSADRAANHCACQRGRGSGKPDGHAAKPSPRRRRWKPSALPEARLSMAQAIIAICESPKSNSVVMALDQSVADAEKGGFGPVPIHLRDTHYAGHERLGSGAEYKYPHDFPGHWVRQEYMPPEVKGRRYYIPSDQGQELKLRERRKLRGIVDP